MMISQNQVKSLSSEFDWEIYVQCNQLGNLDSYEAAHEHWLKSGQAEGLIATADLFYEFHGLNPSDLPSDFDWQTYLKLNPDAASEIDSKWQAICHYLQQGLKEGRQYCAGADTSENSASPTSQNSQTIDHNTENAVDSQNEYKTAHDTNNAVDESNFDWEVYTQFNSKTGHLSDRDAAYQHWLKVGCAKNFIATEEQFYQVYGFERSDLPENFNWEEYLEVNLDVCKKLGRKKWLAIRHFLQHGKQEKRAYSFYEFHNLNASDLPEDFNWQIYLQVNPDLRNKVTSKWQAIRHYLKYGVKEGRQYRPQTEVADGSMNLTSQNGQKTAPNTVNTTHLQNNQKAVHDSVNAVNEFNFDWEIYTQCNRGTEKLSDRDAAYQHWLKVGQVKKFIATENQFYQVYGFERSDLPENFDWEEYLEVNSDVCKKLGRKKWLAIRHFLQHGKHEKRPYSFYAVHSLNPSDLPSDFDWQTYLKLNPDVSNKIGLKKWQAIRHFLKYGIREKRAYKPLVNQKSDCASSGNLPNGKHPQSESKHNSHSVDDKLPDLFNLKTSSIGGRIVVVSYVDNSRAASTVNQYLKNINEAFDHIVISPVSVPIQNYGCTNALCNKTVNIVYPDRYGDAASFLHLLQSGVLNQYDFVCWIDVPNDDEYCGITPKAIGLLSAISCDANVGLISTLLRPEKKHDEMDVDVRRVLGTSLSRLGRTKPQSFPEAPIGPVIWIKNLIIQQLKSLVLKPEELIFDSKSSSAKGRDVLRNLLGILAQEGGLDTLSDEEARNQLRVKRLKSSSENKARKVKVIAFYLPQFHPIPENDLWWGKGFTEWTNVVKSKALFRNHYQPRLPADLGYYDLRLPEAQEAQAALAKEYDIHGFCYYYYWFNGKKLLQSPIEQMLKSGQPDFPFCVCWANENWSRNWDGQNRHVLLEQGYSLESNRAFIREMIPMMQDKRYIRHNDKPVLIVYRIKVIPNWLETAQMWREECRQAGVGEIHLCAVRFGLEPLEGQPDEFGLDSYVLFPPHEANRVDIRKEQLDLHKEFRGEVFSYDAVVDGDITRFNSGYSWPVHRGAMMGWDNTARRAHNARIFVGSTPLRLHYWLKEILDQENKFNSNDESLVFINAWNEWAEGTFLEPDQRFGNSYLEAVKSALAASESTRLKQVTIEENISSDSSYAVQTEKGIQLAVLPKPRGGNIQPQQWHVGKCKLRQDAPSILLCAHISGHQLFGGERSFLDVLHALSKINVNVFVTLPSANNKDYIEAIKEYVVGIYTFQYPQWRKNRSIDELTVLTFSEIIAKHDIKLVHANTIVLLEPLLAARRMNCVALAHARELITFDESLCEQIGLPKQEIIHKVFELTDYVIANSRATESIFQRESRTFYVPNVVNLENLNLANAIASPIRFAIVSSNIPKKGVADFIEVARLCKGKVQNAEFLIIGPENEQIVKWKHEQSQGLIPENIKFLGYRESPREAISEAHVILNLSTFAESFGRTVAEAMAARRPVIAYQWGALSELVKHGVNGYLAPYRDIATVASLVAEFCKNPELIKTMGEAGRQFIAEGFTPDFLHQQLLKAYQSIFASTSFELSKPSNMTKAVEDAIASKRVTIIIPVFNAYEEVKLCIESVLDNTDLSDTRIHIINDGSSDPRIRKLLEQYTSEPGIKITHNQKNLGYTKTINIGIKDAENSDIVLLNSDTIVTPKWLSGLRAAAYQNKTIGTVTAMSDNAGAFSFPIQGEANPKPKEISHSDYAAAIIAATASCDAVDVPTGSGFCMYIRRALINTIGTFDEEAFPRGYGEENDFCMRAVSAGWRNVITPWAFIFHKRTASFKEEKAKLVQQGIDVVTRRYPDYAERVRIAFNSNEMRQLRQEATSAFDHIINQFSSGKVS